LSEIVSVNLTGEPAAARVGRALNVTLTEKGVVVPPVGLVKSVATDRTADGDAT
jgi:hypothetical protein